MKRKMPRIISQPLRGRTPQASALPSQTAPRIVFLHAPKCGGTSIQDAIDRNLRERHRGLCVLELDPVASRIASECTGEELFDYRRYLLPYFLAQKRTSFVTGHFGFSSIAIEHFGGEWNFVSLLRRPVDRWFSLYFYDRYKTSDHFKIDVSLEEYADSIRGQCLGHSLISFFVPDMPPDGPRSEAALVAAKTNVDRLTVTGILEDLDAFRRDFEQAFGGTLRIPHLHKSPASSQLRESMVTPEIRQKVEQMCEPDMKLYEHVAAKVHDQRVSVDAG